MNSKLENVAIKCIEHMLRPAVRFCLKRSLGIQIFEESAKKVFIEEAAEEIKKQGEKVTISRISAITGIQRRAAVRIHREGDIRHEFTQAARVIGVWRQDKKYLTKNNRPRVLSFDGGESEFSTLVRSVSRELHPQVVLFDLERIGAVKRTKNGVKLIAKSYIPRGNPLEGFKLMAEDTVDLMEAVEENIACEDGKEMPNYHAKTQFDNICEDDLPKIREWFYRQCSALNLRTEKMLAKSDLDYTPKKGKKGGRRVVLGIFTRT